MRDGRSPLGHGVRRTDDIAATTRRGFPLWTKVAKFGLLLVAWVHLSAAWPQSAHYTPSTDELLWFLAITDTHVGQNLYGGKQDTENLAWALGELVDTVQPSFLVNAGDLCDATGGGLVPVGQFDKEWEEYREVVDAGGATPDFYFDLPGNHDNYSQWPMTHYMTYSIQGQANNRLNHSWVRHDAKGNKYLFVGLATNGNDKSLWLDDPGLDSTDVAFANEAFANNSDATIAVVVGHHPVGSLDEGQEVIKDWFLDQAVSVYIYGHTHDYDLERKDGTLQLNLRSLGKSDEKQVALVAFDGLGMALKAFDAKAWPQVLVTTPVDANLGGNNPYDYMIPDSLTDARVRAIAFHPDGVSSVVGLLNGATEIIMEQVEDNVWEGSFDASLLTDDKAHQIKVTAEAWGKSNQHQVSFYVYHDEDPINPEDEELYDPEPSPEESDYEIIEQDYEIIEQDYELIEQDYEIIEDLYEPDVHDVPGYDDEWEGDGVADMGSGEELPGEDDLAGHEIGTDVSVSLDIENSGDVNAGDETGLQADESTKSGIRSGGCAAGSSPGSLLSLLAALLSLLLMKFAFARRSAL